MKTKYTIAKGERIRGASTGRRGVMASEDYGSYANCFVLWDGYQEPVSVWADAILPEQAPRQSWEDYA